MAEKEVTDDNKKDLAKAMTDAMNDVVKDMKNKYDIETPLKIGKVINKAIQDYITDKTKLDCTYEGILTEGGGPDPLTEYSATVTGKIDPCPTGRTLFLWGISLTACMKLTLIIGKSTDDIDPPIVPTGSIPAFPSLVVDFNQDDIQDKYKNSEKKDLQMECFTVLAGNILDAVANSIISGYGSTHSGLSTGSSVIKKISFS
jgi:hypothetical protein